MPQVQLPVFPNGSVEINQELACRCEDQRVVYYNGQLPVFAHAKHDLASFRLFTAQLIVHASATQGDIQRAFGLPLTTIKRSTKLYRERGPAGFFAPKPRREGTKLNNEKLAQARALLSHGHPLAVVSRETGVLTDTLRKAIQAKRLPAEKKNGVGFVGSQPVTETQAPVTAPASPTPASPATPAPPAQPAAPTPPAAPRPTTPPPPSAPLSTLPPASPSRLSERSLEDSQAAMGYGTTRPLERVLASCGQLSLGQAGLAFVPADDVPQAGVLFALPALLTEGLLRHTRRLYRLPAGFYPLESIFLLLALLALVRCRSLEQTRYLSPGEWGKILGLDRIPEVRTLREKVGLLCGKPGMAAELQSGLAAEWMAAPSHPEGLGLFYVDGHVRVYHGELGPLPRQYVARQKLCLRGTADFWVNGLGGEPFFVVTQPVHAGLIAALREQIIPQLLKLAPPLPAAQADDPQAMRFTLIFDREGFSPDLFAELKAQRIGVLTYNKYPAEDWPAHEFTRRQVRLHTGETVSRDLAERGTRLSNGLWVSEVRILKPDGHQVSILSTNPRLDLCQVAAWMPARWSQENFLKYMREEFGLDRLIEHGSEPLPETTVIVNPAYRRADQGVRRERAKLVRIQASLAAHTLPEAPSPEQLERFAERGADLREKIQAQTAVLRQQKERRGQLVRKIQLKELPEDERYRQLCPESKHFIDTIKMIAYRAESALAGGLVEHLQRGDDKRALLRRVFVTPANLRPDYEQKTLTVELHRLGSPLQDAAVAQLCEELTATETLFPTTDLRLIYRQLGSN